MGKGGHIQVFQTEQLRTGSWLLPAAKAGALARQVANPHAAHPPTHHHHHTSLPGVTAAGDAPACSGNTGQLSQHGEQTVGTWEMMIHRAHYSHTVAKLRTQRPQPPATDCVRTS